MPDSNHFEKSLKGPFRRILVGLDASSESSSLEIIRLVAFLTRIFSSSVIICTVANIVTSVEGNEMDGIPATNEERKNRDSIEEAIHQEFGSDERRVSIKILHGDPAERIVEYAEFSDTDLIVVGSRSKGQLKRAILGSVSSSVVAKAKSSVLVVK